MAKVISSSIVEAYCHKHQSMTEHVEYVKDDGTKKYVCRKCKRLNPHMYPLYGRQQPSVTPRKMDVSNPNYGRRVA